jgi:Na+/proline symporter
MAFDPKTLTYTTDWGIYSLFHVFVALLTVALIIYVNVAGESREWNWLIVWGGLMICLSAWTLTPSDFFRAGIKDTNESCSGIAMIATSTFIAWIFAKSIYNAAILGGRYGFIGGVAYACYYGAFLCVAVTVYRLRKKGFTSLPAAIHARYGPLACVTYLMAILFRLEQEVWSNALVVASFYGDEHSKKWWLAAVCAAAIPCVYTVLGGLKSSLYSDVFQGIVAFTFLIGILTPIFIDAEGLNCPDGRPGGCNLFTWRPKPEISPLSLEGGLDLAVVGILQGFLSYGFMDPVLTDRAFLLRPKSMVTAYIIGGCLGAAFIMLFSLIGVYGNMAYNLDPTNAMSAMKKGDPAATTEYMGSAFFSIVNVIFITSSISTVDSTFTCTAKVVGPEFIDFLKTGNIKKLRHANNVDMLAGRVSIVVMLVLGLLPLLNDDLTALSATTQTGTLLMGLGPPLLFLADLEGYRPLCFHIPFWVGACLGIVYVFTDKNNRYYTKNLVDISSIAIGDGVYKNLLGINVLGTGLAFFSFFFFSLENRGGYDMGRSKLTDGPFISRTKAAFSNLTKGKFEDFAVHVDDDDLVRLKGDESDDDEDEASKPAQSYTEIEMSPSAPLPSEILETSQI